MVWWFGSVEEIEWGVLMCGLWEGWLKGSRVWVGCYWRFFELGMGWGSIVSLWEVGNWGWWIVGILGEGWEGDGLFVVGCGIGSIFLGVIVGWGVGCWYGRVWLWLSWWWVWFGYVFLLFWVYCVCCWWSFWFDCYGLLIEVCWRLVGGDFEVRVRMSWLLEENLIFYRDRCKIKYSMID